MGWTLDNGEDHHAEAPRSFFIPPAEHRRSLAVGRLCKLIFRADGAVERMWMEVTERGARTRGVDRAVLDDARGPQGPPASEPGSATYVQSGWRLVNGPRAAADARST